MSEQDVGRLAEGNFQITMQLSQHRSLVVSGYLYANDAPGERDKRVDDANDLIDRQFVRIDLMNKEAQRAALMGHIDNHREHLATLAKRREARKSGQGSVKLTGQELQQLQTGEDTVRGMVKQIESLDAAIAEAKKRLGIAAT